jgi:hypothetical protein
MANSKFEYVKGFEQVITYVWALAVHLVNTPCNQLAQQPGGAITHFFAAAAAAAAAAAVVAAAQATDWVLLPSTYIVIRVDGKGFTK